jgi:transketolase
MKAKRLPTDLRSERSFDHVGRDAGANNFIFGEVLSELAERDPSVVAGCADLKYVTHLADFEVDHPGRFFQFGISERNMFSAAAGMAACGLKPYVATFAAFAGVLGYEAIRTDMAYPNLPVRVLATHAGISLGFFGTSHHATEDIAALRAVAGLRVLSAADNASLRALMLRTADHPGPVYFRVGRGVEDPLYDAVPDGYGYAGAHVVRRGTDVLLVSTGILVKQAALAAELLAEVGVSATVLDAYELKPFPAELVADLAGKHRGVVVVEEHNVEGGLGTMVAEAVAEAGAGVRVYKHGLYDEFGIVGPPTHLYRYYGMDPTGITEVTHRFLDRLAGPPRRERLWTDEDKQRVLDRTVRPPVGASP